MGFIEAVGLRWPTSDEAFEVTGSETITSADELKSGDLVAICFNENRRLVQVLHGQKLERDTDAILVRFPAEDIDAWDLKKIVFADTNGVSGEKLEPANNQDLISWSLRTFTLNVPIIQALDDFVDWIGSAEPHD